MPITTQALATDLGVTEDDVKTYMRQLIDLDGEAAVIADSHSTGHHQGSYPIVVTTLTDTAAEHIRMAVAAQTETE